MAFSCPCHQGARPCFGGTSCTPILTRSLQRRHILLATPAILLVRPGGGAGRGAAGGRNDRPARGREHHPNGHPLHISDHVRLLPVGVRLGLRFMHRHSSCTGVSLVVPAARRNGGRRLCHRNGRRGRFDPNINSLQGRNVIPERT